MTKTIYNYSAKTGEFLSSADARESPLEPGIFLMPANATDIEPPSPDANEIAVFAEGAWSLLPDFRDVALWDTATGTKTVIESPGIAPADVGLTSVAKPDSPATWSGKAWVPDVSAIRVAKLADLQAAYAATIVVDVSYMGTTFQADMDSQNTLCKVLAALSGAGAVPSGFYWVDTSNAKIAMTLPQLQGLAGAMMTQGWAAFRKLQDLKTSARAASTKAAIDNIAW